MKIQTYKQEVRKANIRKLLFWIVVIFVTLFLYFFFQGYYIDTRQLLKDRENFFQKPNDYIKPFWVIELNVLPEWDYLKINDIWYPANTVRNIFDYGDYSISIWKDWYYPINLKIALNKALQYYSNNIYLIKNTVLQEFWYNLKRVEKIDNNFLVQTDSWYLLLDSNLKLKNKFVISYKYLWYKFFSNNNKIYYYDTADNIVIPYTDPDSQNQIICQNPRLIRTEIYCNDTNSFLTFDNFNIKENVVKLNWDLVLSSKNIYNLETWKSYSYLSWSLDVLKKAKSIVYIKQKQYLLSASKFILLSDLLQTGKLKYLKFNTFDSIDYAKNFWNDTLIVGKKDGKYIALLKDTIHEYKLDLSFIDNLDSFNIINSNWVYIIKSPKNVYIYYKWWELIKVADDASILKVFAWYIFLNKDDKSYYIDLFQD